MSKWGEESVRWRAVAADMWALRVFLVLGAVVSGSGLHFEEIDSVSFGFCNKSEIIIPCRVLMPQMSNSTDNHVDVWWEFDGEKFLLYFTISGYYLKTDKFPSVDLVDIWSVNAGVASIKMLPTEAVPGNYTCNVELEYHHPNGLEHDTDHGNHTIELRYVAEFWFPPVQSHLVIGAAIMAAAVCLLQVGFVAVKFEMSRLKKISLGAAVLILMTIVGSGAVLFVKEGYLFTSQLGLGLVVLPTIILVPLLFFVLQSVFKKALVLGSTLIILKAVGYGIAVAGFAISLPECPPKHGSVVIAGLGIMGLVAVIAFCYVVDIGTRVKVHQSPKKAVEIPL